MKVKDIVAKDNGVSSSVGKAKRQAWNPGTGVQLQL